MRIKSLFGARPLTFIFFLTVSTVLLIGDVPQAIAQKNSEWVNTPPWADRAVQNNRSSSRVSTSELRNVAPFTPTSHNFSIDIGQVFLMGDLADQYEDNIGWQIHYTYGVSDLFGFDTSLGYSSHTEGDLSMAHLKAGLRTNLSWLDRVIPYVVFGLGFYRPDYSVIDNGQTVSLSPILFGLHLGPGVDLQVTDQIFFGTSLVFHDIFGTKKTLESGQIEEIGGTFTSFLLQAGFTF